MLSDQPVLSTYECKYRTHLQGVKVSHTRLDTNSHFSHLKSLLSLSARHVFPSSQARLRSPSSTVLPCVSISPHILLTPIPPLLCSLLLPVLHAQQTHEIDNSANDEASKVPTGDRTNDGPERIPPYVGG
jgi:hypothetical protein